MSGYKRATVNITRDEYDRLREANEKLRQVPDVPQMTADQLKRQTQEAIAGSVQEIERRQAGFQDLLRGLDASMRQYERSTSHSLQQIQTAALRQAQQQAGALWERVNGLLADQEKYILGKVEEYQQHNQAAVSTLASEIQKIQNNAGRLNEVSQRWLSNAHDYACFIRDNYACEFFQPGLIDSLFHQIEQAHANQAAGMYETTVYAMQQLCSTMSQARLELEQQQNAWQMLLLANWEAVQQIIAHAEQSQYVQAFDLEGSPLPFEIEVDFWSQGKLTGLISEMQNFADTLAEPVPTFGIQELSQWREDLIPRFYQMLENILTDARICALNSQIRINIADLVVKALREQGFHLENSTYESEDERLAYQARLMNLRGNEVVVQVAPTGRQLGENELQLESLDRSTKTEHQLVQRWSEVQRSLSRYGLSIGSAVREQPAVYDTSVSGSSSKKLRRNRLGRPNGS